MNETIERATYDEPLELIQERQRALARAQFWTRVYRDRQARWLCVAIVLGVLFAGMCALMTLIGMGVIK